jgi:hypothetical protein
MPFETGKRINITPLYTETGRNICLFVINLKGNEKCQ